ncbi:hypothetical protein E2562_032761 [Oryza meyeriana var. granulata]|uniref:Uncharacterized protein n=1 Tax=Oryza meyeriana var. granulata TaxID=110450 RepID=A0A6G1F0I9_9ORYZ|nr:hypothetical protein E2562_032761 [Oryza meyeriana var. granulata]
MTMRHLRRWVDGTGRRPRGGDDIEVGAATDRRRTASRRGTRRASVQTAAAIPSGKQHGARRCGDGRAVAA